MRDLTRYIGQNETVIYRTRISVFAFVGPLLKSFLIFGIPSLFRTIKDYIMTDLIVTNMNVMLVKGLFSISYKSMSVDQIETVEVYQPLLGRIFNYGTLTFHGTGEGIEPIPLIDHPFKFRSAVDGQRTHKS
jgi:uncharacterized membrane protein YdbT with pleckstrin-like domain